MATVSPPWSYTLQLPHDPRAPGIARATLRTVLAVHGLGGVSDTAELVAAELLANAHRHTRGPYALRLREAGPDRLRVAVWDADPRVPPGFGDLGPARDPVPDTAEGGRGLHLVRACAQTWGAYVLGAAHAEADSGPAGGGKLLWAECAGEGGQTERDCQWRHLG